MKSRSVKKIFCGVLLKINLKKSQRNPWTSLTAKTVFENPWVRVVDHEVLNPKKDPTKYGVIEFKNTAIGILALDSDDHIYLVGQWRYPLGIYSWEIPEGGGRKNVDPLLEAQRELKEETGVTAGSWRQLLSLHLSNSTTDEYAVVFLAEKLQQGEAEPEDSEVLNIQKVHYQKAYEMVKSGEITDAISVAAIQRLYIDKISR